MSEINYVIFDDEPYTVFYIEQTVSRIRPLYRKVGCCGSVKLIEPLIKKYHPGFIISGIRLSDGLSIDEYKRIGCHIPKIIYTAYPSYFPQLHDLNVAHCSLKPVPEREVELSLIKVESMLAGDGADNFNPA